MVALQGSQGGSPAAGSAFTVERGSLHTSALQEIVTLALKAASEEPLRLVPQRLAEIFGAARVTAEDVGISACSQFSTARNGSSSYLCDTENGHVVPSRDPNPMSKRYPDADVKAKNIGSESQKDAKRGFEAVLTSPESLAVSFDRLDGSNVERSEESAAGSTNFSQPSVSARFKPELKEDVIYPTTEIKTRVFDIRQISVSNPDLAGFVRARLHTLKPLENSAQTSKVGFIGQGPQSVDGKLVIALNNIQPFDRATLAEPEHGPAISLVEKKELIPA